MQDEPEDEVSDEELQELKSILEDIGLREKEVEAYIHRRIWNESLSLVSSKLEIKETTVKTYTSNVQSTIKDILEAADILETIVDSGTNLTETPDEETTEAPTGDEVQPQTTTCLIKYNSTQLSHGKVPAESYPFIENISDAGVIQLDRRGRGKDRLAFNLNHFIETDIQMAAQQYAAITAKTFPSHDFAEEFKELVAELAEYALSTDGIDVDNVKDLHQFISDALNHLFDSEHSDSSVNLPGNLRHFTHPEMSGEIPEIYNETTFGWSSMEFVSDDRFGQITRDLFADPSEKRPFRAAAILASTIGNCLENPLGGQYQIIVQQGSWVIDMSELICQAVSSPAITRIVLINDWGSGSQAGHMTRFETGLKMLANDHPNDITIEDDPNCSKGQRKYIEVTEDRIAQGCWEKNIGQHS